MKKLLLSAAAAALLAACGSSPGGDEAGREAMAEVPASAGANVATFVGYVGALPADDQGTALGVDAVVPPTSDTDEPLAVP